MVGLLIITHNYIGDALLDTATKMLGMCPVMVETLSVTNETDPDELLVVGRRLVADLSGGSGVLVLTDMYGSTPSNIATALAEDPRVTVISGVNLPMLVRVMNYPELPMDQLVVKAESGGRDGIFPCAPRSEW